MASLERARQLLAAQDTAAARRECEALLAGAKLARDQAGARLILAECCRRSGDLAAALTHAQAAIERAPGDPGARYVQAELLEAAGDKPAAIASLRRVVALDPRLVPAWNYLGILLGESGDDAGADAAFTEAVRLDPQRASAWNNLGSAQRALGRLDAAAQSFARALAARSDYPLAAANLAAAQRDLGNAVEAEATARAALARQAGPVPYRALLVILAGLLRERGALDESAQLYVQAIDAAPDQSGGEWMGLARVLAERGETLQARNAYARSRAADATDLRSMFGAQLTLPMIYPNAQAVTDARAAYAAGLATLHREIDRIVGPLAETEVVDGLRWTNFFLAYQGGDDRALQVSYADFAARAVDRVAPHWRAPMAPRRRRARLRVGFASAFFHVGTVGRYFCNWITGLNHTRFEVYVYHLYPGLDEVASRLQQRADVFRAYGGNRARPSVVAPEIRADELDALIYPELGMDATSFALAALRLAPRQYAAWGHPVTTGHATIDAFFTCAAMEPPGFAAHYAEKKLLPLPGIGTCYTRPALARDGNRAQFGLPDERKLLLCPQSLFKIHPDNDDLFARLLAARADTVLILFAGRHPALTDQYMRRLTRACAAHGVAIRERTRVLPALSHEDFLRVNGLCHAMVDTLHWSGGNTSLDALACGLPIVTLPGPYMRGRQSMAMLAALEVPELIARDADDYVRIATELVANPDWRQDLSARIVAARANLFDATAAIERLQDCLQAELAPLG